MNKSSYLSTKKKPASDINKPVFKAFDLKRPQLSTENKTKCLKIRPGRSHTVKTLPRISSGSPNHTRTFAQRLLKQQQPAVLSQEDLCQLTSKFEALTETVVRLGRSPSPLGVRSLESLVSKKVTECLGTTVNSAKFAEAFVRETRRLLADLNLEWEREKVTPGLVRGAPGHRPGADPATDSCYRESYLRQLVVSALMEMCSEAEPGTSQWLVRGLMRTNAVLDQESLCLSKGTVRCCSYRESYLRQLVVSVLMEMCSEAEPGTSQWLVRGLMKTDAVLDQEYLQRVEKEVEDLRKSVSRNKLKVQLASSEVDKLISQHQMNMGVPNANTGVIKGEKKQDDEITYISNNEFIEVENLYKANTRILKESTPKSSDDSLDIYKESTSENHEVTQSLKMTDLRNPCLNPLQNGKPQLDEIVRKKISLAREKSQILSEQISERLLKTHNLSAEKSSSKIDVVYDDDTDDEINTKDTLMFLEALKADIMHQKATKKTVSSALVKCDSSASNIQTKEDYSYSLTNNDVDCGWSENDIVFSTLQRKLLEGLKNEETKLEFTGPENKMSVSIANENQNPQIEHTIHDMESVWWSDRDQEAKEILLKMNNSLNPFYNCANAPFVRSVAKEVNKKNSEDVEKNDNNMCINNYEFTVEEMVNILSNISNKVYNLPLAGEKHSYTTLFPITYCQQNQLIRVLNEIGKTLDGSFSSSKYSSERTIQKEAVSGFDKKEKVASAFQVMSENLSRAPTQLKKQPISKLNPPESLMKTLALLASYSYFKDCFICGVLESHINNEELKIVNDTKKNINGHALTLCGTSNSGQLSKRHRDELDTVKLFNLKEQESSTEIISSSFGSTIASVTVKDVPNLALRRFQMVKNLHGEEADALTGKYEDYLELSTAAITVQNISDMFISLSAVLDSIPDRIKSKRLKSLDPPLSLLSALYVLYDADDGGCFTDAQKTSSLNSMTVQSVSDLFLTLSKTFEDLPENVKQANVLDLDPPRSLLRAVNVLTNSVLGSGSDGQVCGSESQERFYDALDQSSSHGNDYLYTEGSQTRRH